MRTWLPLVAVLGLACEGESSDSFLETKYVRYVTEQPFAPCGGLAHDTDRKIEYLYDMIGEPYPPPRSILYKWVEDNSNLVCGTNALGCARLEAEGPVVASTELVVFHELAHAVHFFALGYSHSLLSEGMAVYYTANYDVLSPEGMDSFASDIESILVLGDVPGPKYPVAALFVGAIIERHGMDLFKEFWRDIGVSTTPEEFRAAYEARFGEEWAEGLTAMSAWKQTFWDDIGCEGDARMVDPRGLHLVIPETCEDEAATGPIRRGPTYDGEISIVIELPSDGFYRFTFVHPGKPDEPVMDFRGCQADGPAPAAPINIFFAQDDETVLLEAGRYLLGVRVPLMPGEAPVEVMISPQG